LGKSDIEGKYALVTGSSKGIGRAVALMLGEMGVNVAVNYNNSKDAAKEVEENLHKMGVESFIVHGDVSDVDQVAKMINQVTKTFGGVDILVNNAGIIDDGLLIRMSDEAWDNVISTNLNGTFYCTRAVLRGMIRRRWGRIINIGSHPEGIAEGERLELTEACFLYALDGVGTPTIKGTLLAGETRVMNRETSDDDPAHTRIGDRQYHHFRFEVAASGTRVSITLEGEAGIDYSLFLRKEAPAFQGQADFADVSEGHRKTLRKSLSAGSWYASVQCVSVIQAEKDESESHYVYSGETRLLNGVAYTLRMDQKLRRTRREITSVSSR